MRHVGPRHFHIDDTAPPEIWEPDRSFDGMTVAIIGGGPSHADIDLGALKGHRFFAINSACRKVRPAATHDDVLYFTDNAWAENRPELVDDWPGIVITANRRAAVRLKSKVRFIDVTALTARMKVRPDYVQASSGHSAACLIAAMGGKRIVLTGFECRAINGRTHGHNDYSQHDPGVYDERFLPGWRGIAGALAAMDVTVLNATPGSAIAEFPFVEFGAAMAH